MKNDPVTSLLLERLERISADSIWAHQASGVRGSLLRIVQQLENGQESEHPQMKRLMSYAFQILENAAREKTSMPGLRKKESFRGK
jgi:hypothetical protein